MEELTKQACEAITYNKGKAYIAKTAQEALNIIGELVGSNKLIVKGKSMTGEEIELRKYLEEHGNEVYETDLGEFIIQKLGIKPMHITAPAIHVPREDVDQLFSKSTGGNCPQTTQGEILPGRHWYQWCQCSCCRHRNVVPSFQ